MASEAILVAGALLWASSGIGSFVITMAPLVGPAPVGLGDRISRQLLVEIMWRSRKKAK